MKKAIFTIMIKGKIYKITNLINGKVYIGQTISSLNKRWKQHCNSIKNNRITAIGLAIQKYSPDNFKIELIDQADTYEYLNKKEIEYIRTFNSISPSGYNLRKGGNQTGFSNETKNRMSKSQKLLAKNRIHPRSKAVFCTETGKVWENAKKAAKEKGIKYSTLKTKLQGINANNTTLRYVSSRNVYKEPVGYSGGNNSQAKTVVCVDTGKVWTCAKNAADEIGMKVTTLRGKLNGSNRNDTSLRYKDSDLILSDVKKQKKKVVCIKTGQVWDSLKEAAENAGMKSYSLSKKLLNRVENNTSLRYMDKK